MTTASVVAPEAPAKPKRAKKEEREIVLQRDGRRVIECNRCEKLCATRSCIVNGSGPKGARMAIIGGYPNDTDDDRGKPWVSPSGVTMRQWLVKVGVNPDRDVYFDNAVKCHPEIGRKPSPKEIKNCHDHLAAALHEVEPDIIIACGNQAVEALLPEALAKEGITKLRGHVFWSEEYGCKIIPMFDPSSVFHDFMNELFCLADLRKAVKEMEHPDRIDQELGEYIPLLTVEDVERECKRLEKADLLVFDTETSHNASIPCEEAGDKGGLDWASAQVLCIGMTDTVGKAWIVPLVGQNFRQIWTDQEYGRVMKAVRHLFESDVPKIAQNGKFDVHMMREAGIKINEFIFDTMLAYSFIHDGASHALEPMRSMFTNMPFYDADVYDLTEGKSHMERSPEDVLWKYCGADVDCTLRVAKWLDRLLDEEGDEVRWVFENISMPAATVASHIEQNGVLIDMELANHIIEETDLLIASTEMELLSNLPVVYHPGAEKAVSFTSPQQVKKLFYTELGLPLPPVLTDKGKLCHTCRNRKTQHWYHTSTDKDAVAMLVDSHLAVKSYQTLTQLHTLKKTFLLGEEGKSSGLLQHVKADGRIHTNYRCDAVETGRWSSSPNLQNLPKETDERPEVYKLVRKLFHAPPGRVMVEVDFSQIELRILAYLSGQYEMITKFEANEDFHLYTARHILWPEIDSEMSDEDWKEAHDDKRTGAKRVNFGIPYGLTAFGMSQWLHCTEEEAAGHINTYMGFFTLVRDYFRKSDQDLKYRQVRKNGFGRKRHFHGLKTMQHYGGFKRVVGHMKREAYNYPIQSTAADVLSLALIAVDNDPWYEEHDAFIVLTVHDSITLECPEELAVECAHRTQEHFEEAGRCLSYKTEAGKTKRYYLPGDAKIGPSWSDWYCTVDVMGKVKWKEGKEILQAA